MYIVDLGFGEYVEFETLEDASKFCDEVCKKTGEILDIRKKAQEEK